MSSNIAFQSATTLRRLIASRHLSCVELTKACIEQYARHNSNINAIVTTDFENALKRAEYLDNLTAPLGPLHGLPIVVKDVFATKGLKTTYGNLHYQDHVPTEDDIIVERERSAGAIILGKSNTPDCASGGITTNEIFGTTKNPWNLKKTTSGSGGGGVAALACGMAVLADGSDVGGSVRSPAGWTNLVGFRPSSRLIPGKIGSSADGGISTAGVFSRSVSDAALFVGAICGPDEACPVPYPLGPTIIQERLDDATSELKVGWVERFGDMQTDDEIQSLFSSLRSVLQSQNISTDLVSFDPGSDFRNLYLDLNGYAYRKYLPDRVWQAYGRGEAIKPSIKRAIERYLKMDAEQIHLLFKRRDEFVVKVNYLLNDYPVFAMPIHPGLAFDIDDHDAEATFDYSPVYIAPMCGLPSICVPAGFTSDGMPHGIMFTGRYGMDQELLKIAHHFETATRFGEKLAPGI